MVNAQEYINQKYPKEKRSEITELDINEKTLEGDLDLTDFIQLIKLDLSNNYLTRIIFPTDARKLIYLDITNNDFSPQDLSVFSQLTNLKEHKLKTGIYNKFFGSLKPLKNLNKLEKLDISNTDIDSGLEYLPESLKTFYCENVPCEKVREWVRKRIIQEEESLKYEDERARNGLFSCYFPLNIADCSYELQT
ncbi:18029_t:CDS:2 [Racocetra persica]|uniref:18029_t:CDS:1 n=1 Tax=Racocetra persica TaxID=160502 RepID=A0ACA9QZM7_9GLOM|nr:18029_t:CDS:2 [Racocetra persica]